MDRQLRLPDSPDFLPDADEGVAVPVELGLGLRFRRLDHQGSGDGPRPSDVQKLVQESTTLPNIEIPLGSVNQI